MRKDASQETQSLEEEEPRSTAPVTPTEQTGRPDPYTLFLILLLLVEQYRVVSRLVDAQKE